MTNHAHNDDAGQRSPTGEFEGPTSRSFPVRFVVIGVAILFVVFVATCGGLAVFLQSILGGEEIAAVESPNVYEMNGVQFEYPGNWTVTEDTQVAGFRYLFVESPGDALVVVNLYPIGALSGVEDFARQFAGQTKSEIPFGTVSDSRFGSVERIGRYDGLAEEFGIEVAGESVAHVRLYRYITVGETACFLVAQTATEDRDKVAGGFELVFQSFSFDSPDEGPGP